MSFTVPSAEEFAALVAVVDAQGHRIAALEAGAPDPDPDPDPDPVPGGRITRQGTRLMLNGKRYKAAGMNWDQAIGCGLAGSQPSDAQADRYFAELNPQSMTRIWALIGMPGFRWETYDRVVKAAERHGQYLCVTLLNGLKDCTSRQATYQTPVAADIAAHVRAVVTRHAGNPTVAMFEPANEANEGSGNPNIGPWYQAMAALIKSHDPAVLVGTGGGNNSSDPARIAAFSAGKDIDLISYHDYYAPAGNPGPRTGVFNEAARRAGKPWYMGERGFCCGNPATGGGGDTRNDAENGRRLVKEYDAYLKEDLCAMYLYWDFKLVQPETSTARPGSALWKAACDYRVSVAAG